MADSSGHPDQAEQELGDQIDNAVPTRGYAMVPVVGLGGSAGSIDALQDFFSAMPPDSGLAFVVVIHLSPEHESILAEVIRHRTGMRVVQVQEKVQIEPGVVYVIPPRKVLRSMDGHIELDDLPTDRMRHVTVDIFFRTLADTHGAHAAAVVMSGMDGDGAIGIKRIKERGGLTVVQDPQEATHTGMPASAIATHMVDWVLPVAEMPARLQAYFRLERHVQLPEEEEVGDADRLPTGASSQEDRLRDVLAFVQARTGRDFSNYKRATVLRRLGRRMQINGIDNLAGYLGCLRVRPGEAAALVQDLLISVTNFFRDDSCFAALAQHLPALFDKKTSNDAVRVWVVATATGEEAYTIAMLLSEHARSLPAPPVIQVFASDLDADAIKTAREGVYPLTIQADVSEDRLRRFFVQEQRGYRVRRELREMVLFAAHDALKDAPFSRLDLVSCRNLLIYLSRPAQARLFDTFHFSLLPRALLFLGSSESMDETSPQFDLVDKKHRIYRQRPAPRSGLPVPIGPGTVALQGSWQGRSDAAYVAGPVFDRVARAQGAIGEGAAPRQPWGETHLRLLEQLSPPSMLVDRNHDILHLSSNAGAFLHFGAGEPSNNLMRAIHPSLRIELRAALAQAAQSRNPVEFDALSSASDPPEQVLIRVVPAHGVGADFFLVILQKCEAAAGGNSAVPVPESEPLVRHLDRELERLKARLRDTVEQFEASAEELKASNEELQAMNEELRSATEELETGREELQSINEELITVNHELKTKVDELSHANSDMQNLMDAAAIAIVFLNRELRITRYTPAATRLFNLIPGDLGRPLSDLTSKLVFPELADDARRVLERLVPLEREVGQSEGRWYVARLLPYRTLVEDRIAGVVLAFIDITERKHAEEMQLWLGEVVAASAEAIFSFSAAGSIMSWNAGAEMLFGHAASDAIGRPLDLLESGDGLIAGRSREALAQDRPGVRFDTAARHRNGQAIPVTMSVSPIKDGNGRVVAGGAIALVRA